MQSAVGYLGPGKVSVLLCVEQKGGGGECKTDDRSRGGVWGEGVWRHHSQYKSTTTTWPRNVLSGVFPIHYCNLGYTILTKQNFFYKNWKQLS